MTKPKLTYFDAPVSRGEECRLALHLAGVDFVDNRPTVKPTTPYGSIPVLELPGAPPLAHSNAILALIGRRHGMHPTDDVESTPEREPVPLAPTGPAAQLSGETAGVKAEVQ